MQHAYDFYKPNMSSEYPVVDGKLSIKCYFTAIDHCYSRYKAKLTKKQSKPTSLDDIDYMAFHTPFCKIVQKSLARMVLADVLADNQPEMNTNGCYGDLLQYRYDLADYDMFKFIFSTMLIKEFIWDSYLSGYYVNYWVSNVIYISSLKISL